MTDKVEIFDSKTNTWIDYKPKQYNYKKPAFRTKYTIPAIGSEAWKKQLKTALQVKSFKLTVSKAVYQELASEIIAGLFQVEAKLSAQEKGIKKAKLFLQELYNDNKL